MTIRLRHALPLGFAAMLAFCASVFPAVAAEQDIFVKTPTGTLWGALDIAEPQKAAVLILPGSGPTNRDGNGPTIHPDSYRLLAAALNARGLTSLRIDKRGIGESASALSSEADIRFQANVDDAHLWASDLKTRAKLHCVWLLGHSEGALVAELAAKDNPDVCGLLLISGAGRKAGDIIRAQVEANPNNPADIKTSVNDILGKLEAGQSVPDPPPALMALFRPSVQPYLMSWLPLDPAAILAGITLPVLIVQGDNDFQISVEDAKLLSAAKPDARLVILPGVNHILKIAPTDRAGNAATYGDPTLPIAPGVVEAISDFVLAY